MNNVMPRFQDSPCSATTLAYPQPAAPQGETPAQRWRRKGRTYALRAFDRSILAAYRIINWLDRRAPMERRYFRVAIFGSARLRETDAMYGEVKELARRLSYMGCDIVTGGGPGLMRAANEGRPRRFLPLQVASFGLTILLPMEEQPTRTGRGRPAQHVLLRLHHSSGAPMPTSSWTAHRHHPGSPDGVSSSPW